MPGVREEIMMEKVVMPEKNTIYMGDCLEMMSKWPDECFDAVVTDPPYNIGYKYDCFNDVMSNDDYFKQQYETIRESFRLIKPGGSILYLNTKSICADLWSESRNISGINRHDIMIWIGHTHTTNPALKLRQSSRFWLWFSKGSPNFNRDCVLGEYRNPDDKRIRSMIGTSSPVWRDWFNFEAVKNVSQEKTEHPCQLPTGMVYPLVGMITVPGGTIFDPFFGSGTVGVAAVRNKMNYIGCEISQNYINIAKRRIAIEASVLF